MISVVVRSMLFSGESVRTCEGKEAGLRVPPGARLGCWEEDTRGKKDSQTGKNCPCKGFDIRDTIAGRNLMPVAVFSTVAVAAPALPVVFSPSTLPVAVVAMA